MINLNLIVCATKSNGIGQAGKLPWRLKEDMNFFKFVTSLAPPNRSNVLIMGRKTWLSIPTKFRPLQNRINIVVSRQIQDPSHLGIEQGQDSYLVDSIESACQLIHTLDPSFSSQDINNNDHQPRPKQEQEREREHVKQTVRETAKSINKVFVIGGSEIYKTVLERPAGSNHIYRPSHLLITRILSDHPAIESSMDAFFPDFMAPNLKWNKSNNPVQQTHFLRPPTNTHTSDNTTTLATTSSDLHPFRFDQLVVEGPFIYKFELWTNLSS